MMVVRIAVALVAGVTLAPLSAADDADKAEREKLAGTWRVTSLEVNGQKPPADATKDFVFVFTADKVTRKKDGKVESETGYRLDLGKTPKWIDFTDLSGKEKDKTFAAVYELDQDSMKFCFRLDVKKTNKRAEKFDGGKDSGQVLMLLKREKP
jgi:uncharacterized protein (TIGR03067 family)